jgi:hypothetical protein
MPQNEKGQPESRPNPNAVVYHDSPDNKTSAEFAQALARSVFGRGYVVGHQPIGDRFRKRVPSRIRAWRAPA